MANTNNNNGAPPLAIKAAVQQLMRQQGTNAWQLSKSDFGELLITFRHNIYIGPGYVGSSSKELATLKTIKNFLTDVQGVAEVTDFEVQCLFTNVGQACTFGLGTSALGANADRIDVMQMLTFDHRVQGVESTGASSMQLRPAEGTTFQVHGNIINGKAIWMGYHVSNMSKSDFIICISGKLSVFGTKLLLSTFRLKV